MCIWILTLENQGYKHTCNGIFIYYSDGEELEDGMENEEDGEHDDVKNFKYDIDIPI